MLRLVCFFSFIILIQEKQKKVTDQNLINDKVHKLLISCHNKNNEKWGQL